MSKKEATFSKEAYAKIALHLAKYYESAVLGYLIGTNDGKISVSDILPVCHTAPAGPILELCGEVAEKHIALTTRKVIGIYFAGDSPNNAHPVFVERVVANLKSILGECIVVNVNGSALDDPAKVFLEGPGLDCKVAGGANEGNLFANSLLSTNKVQLFADFEDHMNSGGAADFTNQHLDL